MTFKYLCNFSSTLHLNVVKIEIYRVMSCHEYLSKLYMDFFLLIQLAFSLAVYNVNSEYSSKILIMIDLHSITEWLKLARKLQIIWSSPLAQAVH